MELNRFLFIAVFLMIPKPSMLSSLQVPCDKKMTSKYVSDSKDLVKELPKMCPQAALLNDSVVIPFVDFRVREWKKKNKTIRGTEILCSLRMLSDALTMAKGLAMPNCTENLQRKLSKVLGELDSIVKNLITQEADTQPPSLSEGCRGKNTTKMWDIFEHYRKLMQGKIVLFFNAIAATSCKKNTR
ncbi:thrombopoietin [Lissotriton helveticus]